MNWREIMRIFQGDPQVAEELPVLKRLMIRTLAWIVLYDLCIVAVVYPVKLFIDELSSGEPRTGYLLALAGSMLVLHAFESELFYHASCWRNSFQHRLSLVLRGHSLRRQLKMDVDWQKAHSTGDKQTQVGRSAEKVELLVDEILYNTLPVLVRITLTSIGMWFLGWQFGMVATLTMILFAIQSRRCDAKMEPLRMDYHQETEATKKHADEITANWKSTKQFGMEDRMAGEQISLLRQLWTSELTRHPAWIRLVLHQLNVVILSRACLYATIALQVGSISVGTAVLATTWMGMSYAHYHRFQELQHRMLEGSGAIRELLALWTTVPTVRKTSQQIQPEAMKGEIEFKDANFCYPQGESGLHQLNFTIPAFTTTAFVGYSGAGKSTVASLVQRDYDISSGQLLIDGVPIADLDYDWYRQHAMAVVSQDVQLFNRSICENIRIVRPEATDQEILEALELAHAMEFVVKLPQGIHTMVGENGVRLSGGQKQRLAIARALLRNPRILILDEATSALDAESQNHIKQTIERLIAARVCTILIIAHRFSTIEKADQIVVMEDGHVSEIGTHTQLERRNGLYKRLRDLEENGGLN